VTDFAGGRTVTPANQDRLKRNYASVRHRWIRNLGSLGGLACAYYQAADHHGVNIMTTRRIFIAAAAILTLVAPFQPAIGEAAAKATKQADFLFVQTARGMSFDTVSSKLTLHDVSPVTLFFADRPDRIAGNMKTTAFVPFWSTGKDSFLSDPPNADISILEGNSLRQVVVELRAPVLSGNDLTYAVKVLQGEMPGKGADVSVFIDVVGMPLTPVSVAGVARRSYRRAVIH
jgi:hypothetical protein